MDYLTILTFISIGVLFVVILRLYNVLGTKTGYDGENYRKRWPTHSGAQKAEPTVEEVVIDEKELARRKEKQAIEEIDEVSKDNVELNKALRQILDKDKDFSVKKFIASAKQAYEIILQAFVEGDKATLEMLLDNNLYNAFCDAIDERRELKHIVNNSFIGLDKFNLIDVKLVDNKASITALFISQLISSTYDEYGDLISGDPVNVCYNKDTWVFQRDLSSKDKIWKVVDTDA